MTVNRYPPWRAGWTMTMVVSLGMMLIPWLGHGAHGAAAEPPLDIMVHQGQLSVHLQDADVGGVLTAIGQQAGITILGDLRPGIRVSMHFSGMVLDEGLSRLLRRASLSSAMAYTRGPMGTMVLTAVHVFKGAIGPVPHPQPAAEFRTEDRREEAGQSSADALAPISGALPLPPAVAEHDGAERLRARLESARHHTPPPEAGEESELAPHVREALEQSLQSPDNTSPMDHRE